MPPTVITAPADAMFAACGPRRAPAPTPDVPAPIVSATLLHVDQLRRALDLELRLVEALPGVAIGVTDRALREAIQALAQGADLRIRALQDALAAMGSAPMRRPCACAEALANEIRGAQWDGDGEAADAVLALALHRTAQLAAATYRGVRTLCRTAGLLAVARSAAQAAREHESAASRFLELPARAGTRESPLEVSASTWRATSITHSAA